MSDDNLRLLSDALKTLSALINAFTVDVNKQVTMFLVHIWDCM